MSIADPHVLPADVTVTPVSEMDDEFRARLQPGENDFAVWRPSARAGMKIVDRSTARLLEGFRRPRRIVEVILDFSATERLDPEPTLREAFPILSNLIDAGILVEEGSDEEQPIAPLLDMGARVGKWEVVTCVQLLNDVELYQVRDARGRAAALKIARADTGWAASTLEREAKVLSHLGGRIAPRLIATGTHQSRPYLLMGWRSGVDAASAADELRSRGPSARRRLLELCCGIADAYAVLHSRGVIHGDIHERNLLIDARGEVCILDFGLARLTTETGHRVPRGGIGTYFEPEYALAKQEGRKAPPASAVGEQYSLAAMLYFLYVGAHYLEFSVETRAALQQTAFEFPLPFSARSQPPFAAMESVLAKALSKNPAGRYPATREFARRLRATAGSIPEPGGTAANDATANRRTLAIGAISALAPGAPLFERGALAAPTCSVNFGAAGIACGFYRLALARDDTRLLGHADAWSSRALATIDSDAAFVAADLDLARGAVGDVSIYHARPGVHLVAALIANAMGDYASLQRHIDGFVSASAAECRNPDLTLGRAGTLLGCALLMEAIPPTRLVTLGALRRLGDARYRDIWSQVAAYPHVRTPSAYLNLGMAHGWAGLLYASLRWAALARRRPAAAMRARLDQLAESAEPRGRGMRWVWREPSEKATGRNYMSGWCNGSAGFVHLWLLAGKLLAAPRYTRLATGAAWHAWDEGEESGPDLCCGVSGRAYGMLAMYRHTGNTEWLERAISLGDVASALSSPDNASEITSLYKGSLGAALLGAELDAPERGRMPLFEHEGWPGRR